MRIAVDAMGGDNAPQAIVEGVCKAARTYPSVSFVLVGREEDIRAELGKHGETAANVEVFHASQVVEMGEKPANAIRRKKDSSISRSMDMVKAGEADAIFSAGSTGAVVVAATLKLRTLPGISRPAIATVFPTPYTPFVLLDAGATIDCTGEMIAQFASMGSVYARDVLGVENPRVGLLSIGEEDAKGNEASKVAFCMLEQSDLNFIGNVESRDLFEGKVDVCACDGFVGNVVLKTSEAVAKTMGRWFKEAITKNLLNKLVAVVLMKQLRGIQNKSNPENYGGAPLLGAKGIVVIGHGSSSERAVENAMRVCVEAHENKLNQHISAGVAALSADDCATDPDGPDETKVAS